MDYTTIKRTIAGQASKLGMKLRYEQGILGSSDTEVVLPTEVPTAMSMALLGMWFREKRRFVNQDEKWKKRYHESMWAPLEVVQLIRGDADAIKNEKHAKFAYMEMMDYFERKEPGVYRKVHVALPQQICLELVARALPHDVTNGCHTVNPMVKRFFKVYPKWRKLIAQCRQADNSEAGIKILLKWATWLVEVIREFLGIPEVEKLKGLVGASGGFAGVDPHDLVIKVPKQTLVDDLAEFFRDVMEERTPYETGAINPQRLPDFWREPEDLYKTDLEKKQKRVKVYLVSDCSGSTRAVLPSYDTIFQAVAKAMGHVCEAVDKVANGFSYDISTECTAFNGMEHRLKTFDDTYKKKTLIEKFTRSVGGGTVLGPTLERIEATEEDLGTKSFVFLFTDGDLSNDDIEMLRNLKGEKPWVVLAIGPYVNDGDKVFRHVARDTEQLELQLAAAVKEAMNK